ncbi:MAG: AsmA family protein [Sterolibacterium sp.]|nr:AsmA family protein [Sterolibacterium sp.]MBP9800115.1 AsmA family protein [Sterolibacterium sp.]
MNPTRRLCLFLLMGFALLMVAAILYLPRIAGTLLQHELSAWLQTRHQRQLQLDDRPLVSLWQAGSITIELPHATLSEAGSRQAFAHLQTARLSIPWQPLLARRIIINDLQLDGLQATLKRDDVGRLNIDDFLTPPPATPSFFNIELQPVHLHQARLELIDAARHLSGQLTARNIRLTLATPITNIAPALDIDDLRLYARMQQDERPLQLELTTPKLFFSNQQLHTKTLSLNATSQATTTSPTPPTSLQARLQTALDVDLAARTLDLPTLEAHLMLQHPRLRHPPLSLALHGQGDLHWGTGQPGARFHLNGTLADSPLVASINYQAGTQPPLTFELDLDHLAPDQLLHPSATNDPAPRTLPTLPALPDAAQMQGRLNIGSLTSAGLTMRQLQLAIGNRHGQLTIAQTPLKQAGQKEKSPGHRPPGSR